VNVPSRLCLSIDATHALQDSKEGKKMLKAKELGDGGNSSARNHAYDINFLEANG
jgi:hypothetical protein